MSYLEELLPEFRKGAKIRLTSWGEGTYVRFFTNEGVIINNHDKLQVLYTDELMADCWELYQEPIDWQYIIDHKCLCFFWDSKECSARISCLKNVRLYDNDTVQYIDTNDTYWLKCRPVRRDEVAFYEDKKDEQD